MICIPSVPIWLPFLEKLNIKKTSNNCTNSNCEDWFYHIAIVFYLFNIIMTTFGDNFEKLKVFLVWLFKWTNILVHPKKGRRINNLGRKKYVLFVSFMCSRSFFSCIRCTGGLLYRDINFFFFGSSLKNTHVLENWEH